MATRSQQTQSGSDVSTTVVTQESQPKTSTTVTAASTQRSVQVEKVGFTLSFTLKINNSLPPKLLP